MENTTSYLRYSLQHGVGTRLDPSSFNVSDYNNIRLFKMTSISNWLETLRFRWFLTYLYGAAPIAEEGF